MGRLSAALIVDADPKGLEALTYGFEGDGCRVASTGAYASVPPMLSGPAQQQLAVVVLREPSAPGVALIRGLRDSAPTRNLPLLVLGSPALEPEVRAAAPGVAFLLLPVFVRDALTAGKMLIAIHEVNPGGGPETDIEGSLSDFGLFFLVRTMIGLGRSGILHLERGNRRGEIRFSEGEVTAAQVGSLQGSAALHHLLLWEEAALSLKMRPVVHRGTFNKRPDDLIDEAERFLRDFAHATKDLGPTRRVLVADAEKATRASDSIPAEVVPVVRLFDGLRTLSDVIEDSPFRVFDTLRIVGRLLDLGILSRAQDGAAPAAAKLPNGVAAAKPAAAGLADWLKPPPAAIPGAPTLRAAPEPAVPATDPGPELPPGAATPAAPHGRDLRNGPSNRRRTKRERTTADMSAPRFRPLFERPSGSMNAVTPTPAPGAAAEAPPAGAAPAPTAPAPATPSAPAPTAPATTATASPPGTAATAAVVAAGERRASTPAQGSMRGELRSSARSAHAVTPSQAAPPAAAASVMVDLPAEGGAAAAGAAATAGSSLTPSPAPTPPPSFAPPPATVLPGSVPLTMHKAKTHAVGVVEAPSRKTNGTALTAAPAEPAASGAGSIQLDPALMAEMEAIDLANVPPTPPPTVTGAPPPAAAAAAPGPAAAAGAPASGRPVTGAPAAVVSFVKGEGGRAAAQARATATATATAARAPGAQPGRPAAVADLPGPATPPPKIVASAGATVDARQSAAASRRPSSEFSALESDFFAREADLFKEEESPAESFDDLDRRRRR